MTLTVPLSLAREQIPTLVTSFGVALRSMSPLTRPRRLPENPQPIHTRFTAPSAALVDQYARWSGAPAERYRDVLPPHFCSHWAFALLARVGGQAPYNVTSILNQGLRLQIKAPLPRDVDLELHGQLQDVTEDDQRVRLHMRIVAGWSQQAEAVIIDSYATIPKRRSPKGKSSPREEPAYETIGTWSVSADDGLNFALLTGDFNPIHTFWPLARRSKFRGCILHGFGTVARTWEVLASKVGDITDIDLRFIKPLPLPNDGLQVQLAPAGADGRRTFRLRGQDGSVHLTGSFT